MVPRAISVLFHAGALAANVYYGVMMSGIARPFVIYGGHSAFLTQWGHAIQTLYFLLAVLYDIWQFLGGGSHYACAGPAFVVSCSHSWFPNGIFLVYLDTPASKGKVRNALEALFSVVLTLSSMVGILVRTLTIRFSCQSNI
jgi:hypothetical protein